VTSGGHRNIGITVF